MIAICDHNSARNVAAVVRAASGTGLSVIPGIEVTTSEEAHILGLFPSVEAATAMQDEVYSRLFGQNDEKVFGYQVVVDEHDMVEDLDERPPSSARPQFPPTEWWPRSTSSAAWRSLLTWIGTASGFSVNWDSFPRI